MTRRTYDLTDPPGTPTARQIAGHEAYAPGADSLSAEINQPDDTGLPGASNRQLNYLTALLQQREMPEAARDSLSARVGAQINLNEEFGDCCAPLNRPGITKRRASEFIKRMLKQPHRCDKPTKASSDLPSPEVLPAGHYAVKVPCSCPGGARPEGGVHIPSCNGGQLRFYHLKRGTRNPRRFWLYIEHGPDETEIPFQAAKTILGQIVFGPGGPLGAARLYGRQIGSCGKCKTRLTNRVSRLLDIGPICGGHMCDPEIWADMKRRAREALVEAGLDPDSDVEDTDDLARIRELAGL